MMEFGSLLEPGVDRLHTASAHLIGESVALEDDRVVIIERLDEIHIVPKAGDELFEGCRGRLEQWVADRC